LPLTSLLQIGQVLFRPSHCMHTQQ
jgi:hypothetical protein